MVIELKDCQHHSDRRGHVPRMVVLHGDASASAQQTVDWLQDPASKVSYHYLIARDGHVYHFVPEHRNAWHAGKSAWKDYAVGNSVNRTSIGVSLSNDGHTGYTPKQYEVAGELVADICTRWGIPLTDVRGHYEVSPGRKQDPWPHFDWMHWYGFFGFFACGDR